MTASLTDEFSTAASVPMFTDAYHLCQRDALIRALDPLIEQSPEAQTAVMWMVKNRVKVFFEKLPEGMMGHHCSGKPSKIILSDDYLDPKKLHSLECLTLLVHEARHAWQDMKKAMRDYDYPSYFELQNGMRHDLYAMCLREADAFACEMLVEAEIEGRGSDRTAFLQHKFIEWFDVGYYATYTQHFKEFYDIIIDNHIEDLEYRVEDTAGWTTPNGERYAEYLQQQAYRPPIYDIGAEQIKALGQGFNDTPSYIDTDFARLISSTLAKFTKNFELESKTEAKIATYTNLLPPLIKGRF